VSTTTDEALRTEHIAKSFGPVVALRDVSITLKRGEFLGIIGDNGAGKSTLMKIITGFQPPSAGKVFVEGQEVQISSVKQARSLGIETVYQDLALVNELSVYHNMFLNREIESRTPIPFLNNRAMRTQAAEFLSGIGVNIPSVSSPVLRLSGGQRQAVAIARALYQQGRILLLDEPLAAMGAKEGALILDLLQGLKERGDVSVIMIDHNYAHLFQICDRVVLLQQGRITLDKPVKETSIEEMTDLVVAEYAAARRERLQAGA
jgi:ABC-type sugar transport system ATPase subunit